MNKPRTDIIDITKIKRPILCWWEVQYSYGGAWDLEIIYPDEWRERYLAFDDKWDLAKTTQEEFEFGLVAWQYV